MIADNEHGKRIVVAVAGRNYTLPPSGVNGHFEKTLIIPGIEVGNYAAVTRGGETRTFTGETQMVMTTELSVINDIDDTVKISNVTDRGSMLAVCIFCARIFDHDAMRCMLWGGVSLFQLSILHQVA